MIHKISCSIVLFNTPNDTIQTLLNCLNTSDQEIYIFIVDNSTLPTNFNFKKYKNITYIKMRRNIGYGSAHNIAIRKSIGKYKYHLVLNPDIKFKPWVISTLVKRIEMSENIGLIAPKILYPNKNIQFSCKLLPTPSDLFFRRFFVKQYNKLYKNKNKNYELQFTKYNSEINSPTISGCFMLFRITALKKIGLFDERFFMYAEDIDITRRMNYEYKNLFFPNVYAIHSFAKGSFKDNRLLLAHVISVCKYFFKWGWFFDPERKRINNEFLKNYNNRNK
jgi:GT2 family glycosyltransferase